MTEKASLDHGSVAVLGLVTICAYGSWYYSFGVLLDPIRHDTGWRESTLAASFSAGTLLIGMASLAGGRLLDRAGHRFVFALAGAAGSAGLFTASYAADVWVFFLGAAIGLGCIGALGFYHVTMATAVRLHPTSPSRSIAVLTIWGAFASVIFLPSTSWLVDAVGWRSTVRVLAFIVAAAFWGGALLLPRVAVVSTGQRLPIGAVIRATVANRAPRLFTVAVAFGGLAMSTLLVYQVPVMTAAGLSASVAATIAGLRGFCQLGGRVPLTPIVRRLGLDRALLLAFCAISAGGALLLVSSTAVVAAGFAVVAGFGIGAFSPLQGMKAEQLFDRQDLGATMGVYGAVLLLAGSVGPITAGILIEATGQRWWAAVIVVAAASSAGLAVARLSRLAGRELE